MDASTPLPTVRRRTHVVALLSLVVVTGLASRAAAAPELVRLHAGDALWTVAVYLALAFFVPAARTRTLLLVALGVSLAVEVSQLARAPWLDAARDTLAGRLLLGRGWRWADLPRYAVGAALAALLDVALLRRC